MDITPLRPADVLQEADDIQGKQGLALPPPDGNPFSGRVLPGEEILLEGNIRFVNTTDFPLDLELVFHLPGGFEVTVSNGESSFSERVKMNSSYRITENEGGLSIEKMASVSRSSSMKMIQKA